MTIVVQEKRHFSLSLLGDLPMFPVFACCNDEFALNSSCLQLENKY